MSLSDGSVAAGRERLLSEGGSENARDRPRDESSDSDVEHEGYIPPSVRPHVCPCARDTACAASSDKVIMSLG